MTPLASGLLLLAIALVIAGYVVACDHFDRGPHDGPWSIGAVLLAGLLAPLPVDAHASIDPAQAKSACVQVARAAASADSRICWAGISAGMPGPPSPLASPGAPAPGAPHLSTLALRTAGARRATWP